MAKINPYYGNLKEGYLFPEIGRRVAAYQANHPEAKISRLGIGDVTEPLTPTIIRGMHAAVDMLGDVKTFKGYGPEQGILALREAIVKLYSERGVNLDISEVFISDGAKPDVANIQTLFSLDNKVAVQDPAYPVYVDTNVVAGRTGGFDDEVGGYSGLVYMPCRAENGFLPDVPKGDGAQFPDLIYLCSPNNPTGAVMNRRSLEGFVEKARHNGSVILFDAAYNWFIRDKDLPHSIYEIPGATECAIEFNSFSKFAGFTGVRLGYAVVPKKLVAENSDPEKLNKMWNRRQTTFFNAASIIAQMAGLAALSPEGRSECRGLINHYMENARIIREGMKSKGLTVYGGDNAPYVWIENPDRMESWSFFDKVLDQAHVVVTPGSGFGPSGQGFTRISAFGHRDVVEKAVASIRDNLKI